MTVKGWTEDEVDATTNGNAPYVGVNHGTAVSKYLVEPWTEK